MLKTLKSKLAAVLAFVTTCAMGIISFADDAAEKTGFAKFWDSYNQLIGYIVAGVIFVVMVLVIIWWIPKDKAKKKK